MNTAETSVNEQTGHQSQNEETETVLDKHIKITAVMKADKDKHHDKHKKRKHSKRPKDKSHRIQKESGKAGENDQKMKEIAGKKQEENSSDSDMQKSQGNAYLEKTKPQHNETQKAVSWKKEIETTQEFQGSVLEQNVVVNLEVPDEEYVKKENDTETSVEGEKLESYVWDSASCGPNITVFEKRPYIAKRMVAKQSTDGARGTHGFTKGRHTFRFKFNDKPWGSNCSIGMCTADTSLHRKGYCHLFGGDQDSWAWDIPSGSLLHNGEATQHYISSIEENLIYMTVDFNKGCLYFQPKDRDRFLAFKGLTGDKELFPCVSMVYGLAEVKIGLKHSTNNSIKVLKQERQSNDHKVRSKSKNTEDITKEDREYLNVLETSKGSNEEYPTVSKVDTGENKSLPISGMKSAQEVNDRAGQDETETAELEQKAQETAEMVEKVQRNFDTDAEDGLRLKNETENTKDDADQPEHDETRSMDGSIDKVDHGMVNSKATNDQPHDKETSGDELEEHQVSRLMTRGQPDGEMKGDKEKDQFYKKSSSLSWADTWQDNDLYIVESGSIIRESLKDRELSVLTQTSESINGTRAKSLEQEENNTVLTTSPPSPAVYIPPNRNMDSCDLEEPEDATYTSVLNLEDAEQYRIQLSHGWDVTNRGGAIHLYPNIPYLCVPMPNFSNKVQGIRGRQGFKEGIHRWKITEIKTFSPCVSLDEMHETANKLHVGVVSDDQRTFNFGYNLAAVGPYVWTYEVDTGLIWHGQSKITDLTHTAATESAAEDSSHIDITKGIHIELNFYKHQLTLRYEDQVIAQIKQIRAKHLYPFLLFNKKAVFPVEIQYLEGPEDYVTESRSKLKKKESLDSEDLVNYRGLTRQMSSKTNIVVVEDQLLNTYSWGMMSREVKVKTLSGGNTVQLSKDSLQLRKHFIALAEKPIFGQRHKIDFTTKQIDSCIFGLASEDLDKSVLTKQGGIDNTECTVSVLGSNVHSWAWDPKTCSLYHGGRYLGRYPSTGIDFHYEKFDRLRLLVDFSSTGYNIASFTAMSTEGCRPLDLGIAFVNLPSSVYPCVAMLMGTEKENIQVTLDYVSGPKGFVTDIVQAKTCNIL